MGDATENDLLDAIKESLEKDGTLGRLNGEIRASVMAIINRDFESPDPPKVPDETKLINELIREYLAWNGYLYTEKILSAESGQKNERLGRDVLTTKFGVMDDSKTAKIPLLYYIVSAFQNFY
ncbi:centrosomal protein 20-like [Diorhabda carinulata]|uniref:centrosomal protein 20-like n=1 Tax=Diorhabda sublineata TaxID=1163346 RepID=UPI0024E162FF|nr:centrosomal protein 20-like [Diorhabda sublineata]XP_057669409.1 centrosomal protein 20-like [Diorhabda carinulata]